MLPCASRFLCLRPKGLAVAAVSALAAVFLTGCGSGLVTKLPGASGTTTEATAVPKGPQLGYLWKADDETLRPVLGIPGASQVGASVVAGETYVAGAGSAASGVGLLVGSDGTVYRMSLPSGSPASLGVTSSGAAQIRFSPSGVAAVVFAAGSQQAVAVTGLTASPAARQIALPAQVADVAVADAGTVAVATAASIEVVGASGTAQPVAALSGPGRVAFVGTSDTLLATDAGANTLWLIRSSSTAPQVVQVASAGMLKSPAGIGGSLDAHWAVVANAGESSVVRVDLTGASAPVKLACGTQPTTVAALAGNGVFRFDELVVATPVWLADITAATPSLRFVPALPGSTAPGVGR